MIIEKVRGYVVDPLGFDKSGHGMEHVDRVLNLSLKFAEKENANKDIVALIALLHDVDDYKLFGESNADSLVNAKSIMNKCGIDKEIQKLVCDALGEIGYSKRLSGCVPSTIESKVVADADMCDSSGVNGILRTYAYNTSKGSAFFDRNVFPRLNMSAEEYKKAKTSTAVSFIFEKILKLKDLMLTKSGKAEAVKRHEIVVDFLCHLFEEENAPEWTKYLDNYLKQL